MAGPGPGAGAPLALTAPTADPVTRQARRMYVGNIPPTCTEVRTFLPLPSPLLRDTAVRALKTQVRRIIVHDRSAQGEGGPGPRRVCVPGHRVSCCPPDRGLPQAGLKQHFTEQIYRGEVQRRRSRALEQGLNPAPATAAPLATGIVITPDQTG